MYYALKGAIFCIAHSFSKFILSHFQKDINFEVRRCKKIYIFIFTISIKNDILLLSTQNIFKKPKVRSIRDKRFIQNIFLKSNGTTFCKNDF